jgi:SPP1 gp7 family putative phage head morphogenesis protein
MIISSNIKNNVLEGIYNGHITLNKLPDNLYVVISKELLKSVKQGLKSTNLKNDISTKDVGDFKMKQSFEENIYRFSAAKTFQEVYEIQQEVFDDEGFKIGFSEFKEQAETIWNEFNEDWLKTEMNTAFSQAQSAEQWQEFEAQKETLPYLTLRTVGDDRVREYHQALDGICLPVDDPFWDENTPPLEWNCRCIVISGDEDNTTPQSEVKERLDKVDINDEFRFNPGKEHIAFSSAHPYFDVPEKYQEFKDNNFNLPLPESKLTQYEKDVKELLDNKSAFNFKGYVYRGDTEENYIELKKNPSEFIETNYNKGQISKNPAEIYFMTPSKELAETYGDFISEAKINGNILDLSNINAQKLIAKDFEDYLFSNERAKIENAEFDLKYAKSKKDIDKYEKIIQKNQEILNNKEKYLYEPDRLYLLHSQRTSDFENGIKLKKILHENNLDGFSFIESRHGRTFGLIEKPKLEFPKKLIKNIANIPITDSIHSNIIHLIEFPELRQLYNYDCGASALQSVLTYYGYERREDELLKKLNAKNTDIFDNGVYVKDIVKVSESEENIKAEVKRGLEPKELTPYIKNNQPVIVLLQAWRDSKSPKEWATDYTDGHYVVAIGYEKDKIIFEDPSSYTRCFISFSELKERWHAINDDGEKDPVSLCIVFTGQKKFRKDEISHMN